MSVKLANEMSFEEKVFFAFRDLNSFNSSCKKIYDACRCYLDPCFIKLFCEELFLYAQKRSLLREKAVVLDPWNKYPKDFDDIFTAVKHKKLYLEYFKDNEIPGSSC